MAGGGSAVEGIQMKILIVSMDFPPHTDGVSTVSHELATRLKDAGEEVIVIGPKSKGDREYDSKQKFRVIRTPFYDFGYLRFIPIFFVMPFIIAKYRIKKVIAMNIAYGGLVSYLFCRVFRFSYILWAYGYEFAKFENKPLMRGLYLKIYKNSTFVTAITDFVKQKLVKFGVSPEKIIIIKPGSDPAKFFPVNVNEEFIKKHKLENKRPILSVGRLIERKGFDMTIRAMKDVLKEFPEAVYLILGNGPFKNRLKTLTDETGMNGSVRFLGRVNDNELLNFYNLCELFIMPSRTLEGKGDIEGFGIVYLEANACGKPAIGGLDGGAVEAIKDGDTGLLVDSCDVKAISGAITKLMSDKNYARRLGENGRKRVLEELNWEKAISQFRSYLLR